MTQEQELLRTLEHRAKTHGEHILSDRDKQELHRLREPEPVEETPIEEIELDELED